MENKLRGAVVGYGFITGKGHVPAYLERAKKKGDVEIIAIADICEARRSKARAEIPGVRVYQDHRALLHAERSNLDFVDISTPPYMHAEITHAALDCGLHVLCEKPLTISIADATSMLEHATRTKCVLFPCHNYKHAPVVKAIRDVIDSGCIGKVRSVTLSTFRNTHAKGVNEWNTHWRREKRLSGGGIAMDHGSHSFYLMFDWLASYPTAVTAKMSILDRQYDTEDQFSATLEFPTGVAHAHLTWTAGVRKVIYTVQGNEGAITVDDDQIEIARMVNTAGPDVAQGAVEWKTERRLIASHWMDASHVTWYSSLFDRFKEAIERGEYVGKEAREAWLCIELITQAYASAADRCVERQIRPFSI